MVMSLENVSPLKGSVRFDESRNYKHLVPTGLHRLLAARHISNSSIGSS